MAGSSLGSRGRKSLKFFRRRRKPARRFDSRRGAQLERLEPRVVLNGIPLAVPDPWYSTPQNTSLVVGAQNRPLLENDWDPEGSSLTASIVTNPASGSLSNFSASAGTFTYTPNAGFTGVDTFTYKVNDGTSDSAVVRASIAVGGHFGPRTNAEEATRLDGGHGGAPALPTGLGPNTATVPFSASGLTGNLEYAQSLTPGLRLLYNSGTFARPIIVLETFLMPSSSVPDEVKAQLTFNGTAGTDYSYNTTGLQAGQALRFALQADASALATGRYAYSVTLTARFGTNSITRTYTGYQEVINRSSSTYEFGRGWQFEGLDRLVSSTGGMLLVRSAGDALWFADNGAGGYRAADGDQTFATLVRNADNSYTLTDKHGIKAHFSSAGLLTSRVDRNNNTTTYTYTNNRLTQVTDPFGRNVNLTYTNGRLTSVTDFAGRSASLVALPINPAAC